MTWSNLRFNVWTSSVTMATFTLLKYVKSQRSYGFLITKELIFGWILKFNSQPP